MQPKHVLIACEYSGIVRDAFTSLGCFAISCDLLPTESRGPHIIDEVQKWLRHPWDLVIAHPPCTYLCNSGVRWLHSEEGRYIKMLYAVDLFNRCLQANSKCIVVENPIMHRYAREFLPPYTQIIHPWQYGHGETKSTCLWIKGLPSLKSTAIVHERVNRIHRLPPSKDRSKLRSKTYTGIAHAMATQWYGWL